MRNLKLLVIALMSCVAWTASAADASGTARKHTPTAQPKAGKATKPLPKKQVGKASIYAKKFNNRKMANGERMDPNDDNAASKTLPLGTRARVTNLETGKSANVTIEDRGPYVEGRIVDLSPATAAQIGLGHKQGIAPVEVTPLHVPEDQTSMRSGSR